MTAKLSHEVERTVLLDACIEVLREILENCTMVSGEDLVITKHPEVSLDMQRRISRLIEQRERQRIYD